MASWSANCTQQILPFSLGVPASSRAEAQQVLPKLIEVLINYKAKIRKVVHDADRGTAALYVTSKADSRSRETSSERTTSITRNVDQSSNVVNNAVLILTK
ncbi:predicted protein [Aspergillus nidulans FGSC A4]|uniref:Uncharacterized protein n=1 Tax=Emericella nidulans (strain FGSC A4 / ATCC 38163 / CBS 112.46 / NRRL 194 / M139) TaxID=227321 RepID=Q5B9Y5_EMENI|nr:hypothetical protein [Aspergillus nidulans FGSC A4]EAA63047.1 predicted protein [Aspergillus nidulans FGSC A4]CBF84287.1 TPA: hypothetical protein ANIA_02645 [Aspergillus nidulans FGSC A4]|eukprot:XP_660249.1 predicted protein [Aspergillus nidulans FGSC A4]